MQGLYGTYEHTIDAKGRVSFPSKFRKVLSEDLSDLIVIKSEDTRYDSLNILSSQYFETWHSSLYKDGFDPDNSEHLDKKFRVMSGAEGVEVDSAGRINISQGLRDRAHMSKDVVIVGVGDYVSMWDAAEWKRYKAHFDTDRAPRD